MKLAVLFLAVILAFLISQSRVLGVGGVNPNLLLIVFTFLTFALNRFIFLIIIIAATAAFFGFFYPWWLIQASAIFALAIVFYFLRNHLTDIRFLNFMLAVLLGTVLFYLIINALHFSLIPPGLILPEILYNLFLGLILWPVMKLI